MSHNKPLKVSGTGYMGDIHAPYKILNKAFGKKQSPSWNDKTSAEWHVGGKKKEVVGAVEKALSKMKHK